MTERLHLPPLLNEIAEVAGVVAALAMQLGQGGTKATGAAADHDVLLVWR